MQDLVEYNKLNKILIMYVNYDYSMTMTYHEVQVLPQTVQRPRQHLEVDQSVVPAYVWPQSQRRPACRLYLTWTERRRSNIPTVCMMISKKCSRKLSKFGRPFDPFF